jgi:branched-chain amino acid transport system substrate-binding protein
MNVNLRGPAIIDRVICLFFWLCLSVSFTTLASDEPVWVIGLDADLSSASAAAGEAIRQGALIALHEINQKGGVKGRKIVLDARDHRGNPARAIENVLSLAENPDLLAIIGGLHTPVALEVLPLVHQHHIPFLIPWAAGTAIIQNGYDPNYVFRVSLKDEDVGPFLVESAVAEGHTYLGLLLENTSWGRSNYQAMTEAARKQGIPPPAVEWFNWGVTSFDMPLKTFGEKKVEAILLVANSSEGAILINEMANLPAEQRIPLFSHWGITGGDFYQQVATELKLVDLRFVQTFTVCASEFPQRTEHLVSLYRTLFDAFSLPAREIPAAPGLAHTYDLVHLFALAVDQAKTAKREEIRQAMESLPAFSGVMTEYQPAFSADRHDALSKKQLRLARYDASGAVVPLVGEACSP